MLTSNINFKNFKISKKINKNKIKFQNEKWFKKIELLKSLQSNYEYSYSRKQLKKIRKNKNFRLIGMGGSTLGAEAIYQFLNHKVKKKILSRLSNSKKVRTQIIQLKQDIAKPDFGRE